MVEVGYVSLVAALVLAIFGIVVNWLGVRQKRAELITSGQNAVYAVGLLVLVATLALWHAILTMDFSVEYVATHVERALPLLYKFSALWGGQAGSLLFWTLILSGYSVLAIRALRRQQRELMPYASAVLLGVSAFFLITLLFAANPFKRLDFTPADGQGLNPLLQNYWMVVHPVGLYLGFVGFSVPFAFAVAALASRQLDNRWVRAMRRWTLVPWLFLSLGILMGSMWAYVELGWGGFWAWDPVENASLLPWLTGTAFLHSIVIQEKRGMLKVWNVFLIFITFSLTIIGTFITRSGVIQSVHSFALSNIGPLFLAFIALVMLGFLYLLFDRLPLLRAENELDSMRSREFAFLLNNLVFVIIAFATLLGTLFPMLTELLGQTKIAVSAPFFNKVNGPIFLILLILMGVGPLLGWRRTSDASLLRNFVIPLGIMPLAALIAFFLGARGGAPLAGIAVCAFVTATIMQEFVRGAQARRQATGEGWGLALLRIVQRNQRRYGGYIVHLGVVLMALGIIGSTFFQAEGQGNLAIGETISLRHYTLVYRGLRQMEADTHTVVAARLDVLQGGRAIGTVEPHRNLYHKAPDQPTSEVGILVRPLEDVYVVLAGWEDGGRVASFKVYINPLISWLWLGGLVLMMGTLISLWPYAPEGRRVARTPSALPEVVR
jgi:cytochrome c-type biogenesis protein CcmF